LCRQLKGGGMEIKMQKNDVVRTVIEDMSHKGEGIGKAEGYPLFVKDTVIGDELEIIVTKAGKSYGYGRVKKIIKPSPYRVEPKCPHAGPCGGCQLQAMAYDRQLQFKEDLVRNNLKRIGGFSDIPMEPIVGMEEPFHYRNKAQFPVGKDKDGKIVTGFYAGRSHRIVNNRNCCLGVPVNEEILNRVISYMEENHVEPYDETTGEGVVRHILIRYGFATKEIMVCLVINAKSLPAKESLVEKLISIEGMTSISININRKNTNVIMGETVKTLWGKPYIRDFIGDIQYQISPLSFYQVNPIQTKKLYELALSYAGLTGKETVWDLYCGIGTISLFMAQKARKVYGVEIVPAAIEDARRNAGINGIENAEFFVGKAEEVLPRKYEEEGVYADVIVVDPPRKGCDEKLLETMVQMAPEKIVYVSCDSATLARDLKYLCGKGYKLDKIRPVDQFGMTVHVETVVLMSRVEGK
jgi:23S rRNA (uracil1939-C5)-methyltransferase